MNDTRTVACATLCAVLMLGCGSAREGTLRLYQRNSGDIISMDVGEVVEVVLDGDPGTEIHWIKVPDDPDIIDQLGETEYQSDMESHRAERKLVTRFRATAPGRTRLQLSYRDPAEARRPSTRITPGRVFEVWVVVKESG